MIYCAHGVVKKYLPNMLSHKHFIDAAGFKNYLKAKTEKYVTLENALNDCGDALTIDDSTYAALEMAKILREYGHQVTMFINPYYIEHNRDYWFLLLSYVLDCNLCTKLYLDGRIYTYDSYNKQKIRRKLKNITSILPAEIDRLKYLEEVFKLDLNRIRLPYYLKTINKADVYMLKKIGVNMQNHGWTHKQLITSEAWEINDEISKAKDWFGREFDINTDYYAVPFGEKLPPERVSFVDTKCWFLQRNDLERGLIQTNVYNRKLFKINN